MDKPSLELQAGERRIVERLLREPIGKVDLTVLSASQLVNVLTHVMWESGGDNLYWLIRHVQRSAAYTKAIEDVQRRFAQAERECGDL